VELYLLSRLRPPDSALSAAHKSVVSELMSLGWMNRSDIDIRSACKQESSHRPATPSLRAYFQYRILKFSSYNKNHVGSLTWGILRVEFRELPDHFSIYITHKTHFIDACNYSVLKGHPTISRCDILLFSAGFSSATEETRTRFGVWWRKQKDGGHLEETGANGKVI
jgi:hypothetical protein